MLSRLFEGTVDRLSQGLAFARERQAVVARNIANAETPGYQAQDVVFDDLLASASSGGPGAPAAAAASRQIPARDGLARSDGNDVHLDRQMARLAETQIYQQALVQILSSHFTALKQAISGRV